MGWYYLDTETLAVQPDLKCVHCERQLERNDMVYFIEVSKCMVKEIAHFACRERVMQAKQQVNKNGE